MFGKKKSISHFCEFGLILIILLIIIVGPLQFMSGRLLWLHQKESALISVGDLNGTNTYQMKQPDQRSVVSFLVVDESQQPGNLFSFINLVLK